MYGLLILLKSLYLEKIFFDKRQIVLTIVITYETDFFPLCDEYIKKKNDSLKIQEKQSGRNDRPSYDVQK